MGSPKSPPDLLGFVLVRDHGVQESGGQCGVIIRPTSERFFTAIAPARGKEWAGPRKFDRFGVRQNVGDDGLTRFTRAGTYLRDVRTPWINLPISLSLTVWSRLLDASECRLTFASH